jgi:hypothetical protein
MEVNRKVLILSSENRGKGTPNFYFGCLKDIQREFFLQYLSLYGHDLGTKKFNIFFNAGT